MKVYVIDTADRPTVYASSESARQIKGRARFATEKELAAISGDWSLPRLVAIWNNLPGVKPVRKFTDRNTALRRIWAAMQDLEPRPNTKTELIVYLLQQPSGATLRQIMAATGWQAHSVRGFISGHVFKKLGLRVMSFKNQGERAYRIR